MRESVTGTQSNLTQNSIWMVLARFGAQGLTIAFTVVLARRLGTAGFGEYALIAALLYVANSVTTFGTDMVLIRQIAARGDLSGLPGALFLQLVISAVLVIAVWLFGPRIPNQSPETLQALRIYVFSLFPLAFFTVFSTALRGLQRMGSYALLSLITPALQAAIVLLPAIKLVMLCTLLLGVQVAAAIAAGWMCSTLIPRLWRLRRTAVSGLRVLIEACAPLAGLTVLGMAYQRLGIYMLSTMTNAANTGLFSAAARTVEASKTVHLAVFAALYPVMALARRPAADQKKLAESIHVSRNILLAGGTIAAAILFVLARPIVVLLYGTQYLASAPILRVLSWILIPFTVNSYLTLSFVASNRELVVGRALVLSLLALVLLNLWLLPAWGVAGSAWASLIAECVQSAVLLMGVQQGLVSKGVARELPDLPG